MASPPQRQRAGWLSPSKCGRRNPLAGAGEFLKSSFFSPRKRALSEDSRAGDATCHVEEDPGSGKRLRSHAAAESPSPLTPQRRTSASASLEGVVVSSAGEDDEAWASGYRADVEAAAQGRGFPVGVENPAYLDFAGAGLVSTKHAAAAEALHRNVPAGNPHTNEALRDLIAEVRLKVLQYFNAPVEDYSVVFTANATAAVRIVSDHFPYTQESVFAYDRDCHTCVLGMRNRAKAHQASVGWYDTDRLQCLSKSISDVHCLEGTCWRSKKQTGSNLLVVTGESNFSGNAADLTCVRSLQEGRMKWRILLDAAKLACSQPIDLGRTPVDFMAISFYKMFGRPHGLGALLVRKDAADLLMTGAPEDCGYFAGGTVAAASATSDFVALLADSVSGRFEFGTPNTFAIAELPAAFEQWPELHGSLAAAGMHGKAVARAAARRLRDLRHSSGRAVVEVYGGWSLPSVPASQGATIAFNVLDREGDHYPYDFIDKLARPDLVLRSGSLCNHGACQKYLGLTPEDIVTNYQKGHTCQVPAGIGVRDLPTGALRVSFGATSSLRDVERLLRFLERFVDGSSLYDLLRAKYEGKVAA